MPQPVPTYPTPESENSPAITAGTPVYRNFGRDIVNARFPYRRSLFVDNTRGSGVLTLVIYAATVFTRKVGINGTLDLSDLGPIYAYSIDSTSNESAGVVTVYENGGLTEP